MSEEGRPTQGPSPWALVAIAASLGFLVGGLLLPGIAETLLRVFIASLALGWGAARALKAGLPTAVVHDGYSPFDDGLADPSPPAIPDVVRRRARVLVAVDDPDGGALRPIPWEVERSLVQEAARRLEKGHGMMLGNATHAARIRGMVSDATWTLLGRADDGTFRASLSERAIPLARMDDILDDLERL